MESRRKINEVDDELNELADRIRHSGGMAVAYDKASKVRSERDRLNEAIENVLEQIQDTGCVVKDLDVGLLDFPARINDEDVYLCWKLGEDRIRFYHRQDEGFSGRKPIDPRDAGYRNPIQ
jgi:hypothetical protein